MARNFNDLFEDMLFRIRSNGTHQESRNGAVLSMPHPVLVTVTHPFERVVFSRQRRANPYFHVMETVWMLAGCKEVEFLLPFNGRMQEYADGNTINGAYGHRWRKHWHRDQIACAIEELKTNPTSRQVLINMWDPDYDQSKPHKDRPCNTSLMFRYVNGKLDMTVTNRSNDLVWGMCGANAVHMTYLHELVARASELQQGNYHVMSNNLHIYEPHWHFLDNPTCEDNYGENIRPYPILQLNEHYVDLLDDCERFVKEPAQTILKTKWMQRVVSPMYNHYMERLKGNKRNYDINENCAPDWRLAEYYWRIWND